MLHMPCVIKRKRFFFNVKEVYCAEEPYEDEDADYIIFYHVKRKDNRFHCHDIFVAVLDLRPNLDELFKGLDRRLREDIRRAYREGVVIYTNKAYEEFHKLALDFHRAKGLPLSLVPSVKFMQENGYLLTAYIGGRLVAGQFYMGCYPTLLYHTASRVISNDPKDSQAIGRAVKALVWEAIKLGKLNGYLELNLGEISKEMTSGIDFFKLRFGAKPQVEYVCKKANNWLLKIYLKGKEWIKA